MKAIRVVYSIFFSLFLLLLSATFFAEQMMDVTEKSANKKFEKSDFQLKRKTFQFNNSTLEYFEIGPDTAQRILFLHGSPGNWSNFLKIMQHKKLYENYHLIALNRIGYGMNYEEGGKADMNLHAASLLPLIKDSPSGRKPVLVGHSLGGPIVIKAAMNYSDKLQGVFSLAGSLDGRLEPREWYRGLYKVFPINLFMVPALKSSNDELFTHAFELYKMESEWNKIQCPVFIMQGMKDILVDKRNADFAEKKLNHIKKKKIIRIENEDHFVVWTIDSLIVEHIVELSNE